MKKLILCLCFSLATSMAFSQKIYFVYLQSESEQPFYAKINEKVYSSTAAGYCIVPRLRDSTYSISIGFPGNKWPEQSFSVVINKKDRGYLLKYFGEKGWGLFDLQNLSVQMAVAGKASIENKTISEHKDESVFTDILSKAADDPSLKENPVRPKPEEKKETAVVMEPVKKEETTTAIKEPVETTATAIVKKEEPVIVNPVVTIEQPVTKKDVSAENTTPKMEPVVEKPVENTAVIVKKEEVKEQPAEPVITKNDTEEVYTKSEVIKGGEMAGAEGHDLIFIDNYGNGKKDTIRLLIPNPKPLVEPVKDQPKEEKKFLEISNETAKKEETVKTTEVKDPVKEETPVVTLITPVKEEPTKQVVTETVKKEETKPQITEPAPKTPVTNSCPGTAEESDFLKLRRKMASVKADDDMVTEARKYFKTTCFTVYQLRNLGALFLTDEGKYKFFDAAYAHASDAHNFISLQLELKDEYYIKRFKAMLK